MVPSPVLDICTLSTWGLGQGVVCEISTNAYSFVLNFLHVLSTYVAIDRSSYVYRPNGHPLRASVVRQQLWEHRWLVPVTDSETYLQLGMQYIPGWSMDIGMDHDICKEYVYKSQNGGASICVDLVHDPVVSAPGSPLHILMRITLLVCI